MYGSPCISDEGSGLLLLTSRLETNASNGSSEFHTCLQPSPGARDQEQGEVGKRSGWKEAGSAPCDAAKVSRGTLCPGCSVHRDSLWPRHSNTTAVSQEPTVTRSPGGRVEQPGASLSLRRCSGSQSRLSGGDTQLRAWRRSWASGPRRPPRLPGCTGRCCSGRVSGNHRDRPLQTSAPLVLPSLGAEVSSFPSSPSFDISPSFLFFSPVFFLPSIAFFLGVETDERTQKQTLA